MELQERLKQLETVRDWQGLVEELEKGIQSANANESKASYHLRLGQVLEAKFLSGVKALKHFQDAYKLNPALSESLEAARSVYWSLGKLNMAQKLLELELRTHKEGAVASELLLELADVLCDMGDYDKATSTYARSLATSGGTNGEARACLEDVQAESGSWQQHVQALVDSAAAQPDSAARARLYLRAARVTRRFQPEAALGMLEHAYAADPTDKQAAALFEGALAEAGKLDDLDYFSMQARATELVLGVNAHYGLSEYGEKLLLAGVYYRLGDAVVPMVGFQLSNIQFAFSYDVTLSGLSKYNNYRGALEFSLIKKGFYPENVDRKSLCPTIY